MVACDNADHVQDIKGKKRAPQAAFSYSDIYRQSTAKNLGEI